jgi:hypothetical protein
METNLSQTYSCEYCNINPHNKKDYIKHTLTAKHKRLSLGNIGVTECATSIILKCDKCCKEYKSRVGLWKHKKKCGVIVNETIDITDKQLIINLLQQNAELQKSLIELSKEKTITNNNTTNSTNTNSHNKTFNLQFFLNETCKDALNINDFVSSIRVQLTDLETTGRVGYVEGISKIVIRNLNNMEQYRRPMHCSDGKREIMYIKDNGEWTKEDTEKPLLTRAIKIIANENIKKISEWKHKNPDCTDSDSNKNNVYLNIVSNAMSGSSQEETNKNIEKIISNIVKETQIEK